MGKKKNGKKEIEKYRSRKHGILLYPDNEEHMKTLEKIKNNLAYQYAFILHDKDKEEDGKIKKEHYHVILKNENAIWNTALSDEIGLELRFIEPIRNDDNALSYLIHLNDIEKHQYSIDEVQGTLKKKLQKILMANDKTEDEVITEIFDFIETVTGILTISALAKWCVDNGKWIYFRRSSYLFVSILNERNYYLTEKKKEKENNKNM